MLAWILVLGCAETVDVPARQDPEGTDPASPDPGGDPDVLPGGDTDTAEPLPPPAGPPCTAWGEPTLAGEVGGGLHEASAIVASWKNPGVLWVLEDAFTAPILYALDSTGALVGTLTLDGVENVDWEALALGPCAEGACLWIGDIGNNRQDRDQVRLLRVPEPEMTAGAALHAVPTEYPLVFEEGAVDAEALAMMPDGTPVIVSKRYDWSAGVYLVEDLTPGVVATPRRVGTLSTARDGETDMDGAVTAADVWPDGSRLLVRTYGRTWEYDLGDAGLPGIDAAPRAELPFGVWENTEGVAYDPATRGYWQVEEWGHAPLWYVPCLD